MTGTTALAKHAVEALLDNEALRGDLSDDGFGPLLNWATGALTATARAAGDVPDVAEATARLDAAGEEVRGLLAAAVQAAQRHTRDDLLALLREPLLLRNTPVRLRVALTGLRLGDDPDINAARLARALNGLHP